MHIHLKFFSCAMQELRNSQIVLIPFECTPQKRLGRAFSDILLYSKATHCSPQRENVARPLSSQSSGHLDDLNDYSSSDTIRLSLSSAASSSTPGSPLEDCDNLGDVIIWGKGTGEGLLGGSVCSIGKSSSVIMDTLLPTPLETTMVLDALKISCGSKHAVLVTKQGHMFSWGEGSGGKLGHGVEADVSTPKLVNALSGLNIESVACGEYHTCAITMSGDLYTWGDGIHNFGLLGHGTEVSHWTPKKLRGQMEGMHVSFISCGPWHSAAVTSAGLLFTFGDGTFGALGHGNRSSTGVPKEVETLKGLRTVRVSCGVWHTAAIVDSTPEPSSLGNSSTGKLFTWGDGDKGQLGHGDKEPRLIPTCVAALDEQRFCQVACGHSMTVSLSTSGQVYTMGNSDYGQLGSNEGDGKLPKCIEGKMKNNFIEEIACGSHHVVALNSKAQVYTWGNGANGQLGHGDNDDRNTPTLVEALLDRRVKSVACGSNFTVVICLHKPVRTVDQSLCSGCQNPFNIRRKRHNCYNCGLVFCKLCSCRRSLKASLAPNMNKPYRVCEDCYLKLNKNAETRTSFLPPKVTKGTTNSKPAEVKEQKILDSKPRGLISRLSSFDSFRRADSRKSLQNRRQDSDKTHVCQSHNGSFHRESSCMSNSSPSVCEDSERISASLIVGSQATSPVSVMSSPYCSMSQASFVALVFPEVTVDDSNTINDSLTKEISILREQVSSRR